MLRVVLSLMDGVVGTRVVLSISDGLFEPFSLYPTVFLQLKRRLLDDSAPSTLGTRDSPRRSLQFAPQGPD